MTRPNPDTQGTAPSIVQDVLPQLMTGPDSDTQRAAPPTTPDAPAQQNERITQPQKENPVLGPDSGTQRSTPPQGKDPINRPDPHNQSPAPPLPRVPPPIRMRDSHNPREKTRCQDQNQAPREQHPQQSEVLNPDQTRPTQAETSTPTVQGAPAHQNEKVTQPQRETPVPRPESDTQRVTPPTVRGAQP